MEEGYLHTTPITQYPNFLPRKKNAGFSIMELVVATGVATLVCFIVSGVWISAIWSYDCTNSQTIADTDAALAMQKMIADVREAKSFDVVASDHLRIIFPVKNQDGTYNRTVPDTNNPVDYFLSDSTGIVGRAGTWLWRQPTNGVSQAISRKVVSLVFESDTPKSVGITVSTRNNYTRGEAQTSLTERVVYLRNY